MSERGVRVRVVWDTEGQGDCSLPEIVGVPEHIVEAEDEEEGVIADWLSDEYGFCIQELSFVGDNEEPDIDP